jgi:hypothetical protein
MSAIFIVPATAATASVLLLIFGYRLRRASLRTLRREHGSSDRASALFWLGTTMILGALVAAAIAIAAMYELSKIVGSP